MEKKNFKEIEKIKVKDYCYEKNGLNYLSWAEAVKIISTDIDPDWYYEFMLFSNGSGGQVPYMYDPLTGYMVGTRVRINGQLKEMYLPVMENHGKKNFAKKDHRYKVDDKYSTIVNACDMFDINKTLMRCLVKNIAMFGLGINLYTEKGESDETEKGESDEDETTTKKEE